MQVDQVLVADERLFNIVKDKWNSLTEEQIKEMVDPPMVDFIKRINEDPFMATMYCCSGHPEKYPDDALVNSYLVVLIRPEKLSGFKFLVKWIECQPGYRPLGCGRGWTWLGGTIPILPFDYPVEGYESASCVTLYLNTPQGVDIMKEWETLFDMFIFRNERDSTRNLYERIRNHMREKNVRVIMPTQDLHIPTDWDLAVHPSRNNNQPPVLEMKVLKQRGQSGHAVHTRSFHDNFETLGDRVTDKPSE